MAVTRSRQPFRGGLPIPPAIPPRLPKVDPIASSANEEAAPLSDGLVECAQRVADWHITRGAPILASCSLLAVDNIEVSNQFSIYNE